MRDHGGDIDAARARWGEGCWVDLSTGINRVPWPVPSLPGEAWQALPTRGATEALLAAARAAYGTAAPMLALPGAQAAIQLYPRLLTPGRARVLGPTYNEHAASLEAQGWRVETVSDIAALAGADLAVVVNPNNPDGQAHPPDMLRALAGGVGLLVVDESFADPTPALSLAGDPGAALVLRSFGKFYGLAGLRLGFAIGPQAIIDRLAQLAGPWPVAGPSLAIGAAALADRGWAEATTARLASEADRLDSLAWQAGWQVAGGTTLFRLFATPDARAARDRLARAHIWSRVFPWHPRWLRLGLPGSPDEWSRLEAALSARG